MKPSSRPDTAPSLSPFALHEEEDERAPQVSPERRRKLTRYVAATVCVCVALCLTALVRVAVAHGKGEDDAPVARTSAPTTSAPVAAASPAAVVATQEAATPAPLPAATAPAKTAREERDAARRALEAGHARDALAAAERATALDPKDADGWLLIGAANQTMGHAKEARAAFTTCVKTAKRGPVRECRSMLR
jgi:hypothetical protein